MIWIALLATLVAWTPGSARAQSVGDVFRTVEASVVVVRARGHEVSATTSGVVGFTETGSGVLVSADGKVMTAAHVVSLMDEVTVEFLGGEAVNGRVVASEPAADLALLQLERVPPHAQIAPLADSNGVRIGDQVIVIGAPYGLGHSLSVGWISARWGPNTVYRAMPLAEFFQTDAVINTGNSGGPMFDMAGQVIGIVSHNISKSGGSEGLGFVVTANTARALLLEKRSFWSGLEGQLLSPSLADILNVPADSLGYLVKTVAKGSPAESLGIRGGRTTAVIEGEPVVVGGDIILRVDDIRMTTAADALRIRERLNTLPAGASITVRVFRSGRVVELTGPMP